MLALTYTLDDLPEVAENIISQIDNKIILFDAEMAVGKTTLIKAICKYLGVKDVISSPTYGLVNEYHSDRGKIYHFDFYRIKKEEEAYDIGFEEYLYEDAWKFIEWPERIENLIPEEYTLIEITLADDGKRKLKLS